MKIGELLDATGYKVVCEGDREREISGALVGDLLSFVISEAKKDWVWVTIQVHINVSAVAVLKEIPLIIIASGREPSEELLAKCREENIALALADESAYMVCGKLYAENILG